MTQEILVVDDSRTVRTVVEWVFHGSPFTIRAVGTASDALRSARESRPAVILVDYTLPDQSGFELCEDIRREPALSAVPILMLGGTWSEFDEGRVTACGADDFIYKPFKTDALIEKVTNILARGKARPVMLTPAEAPPAVRTVPPLPGAQMRPASQPAAELRGTPASNLRGTPAEALHKGPPPIPGRTPQPAASQGITPVAAPAEPSEPIEMGQPLPGPGSLVGAQPTPLAQQAPIAPPAPAAQRAPIAPPAPAEPAEPAAPAATMRPAVKPLPSATARPAESAGVTPQPAAMRAAQAPAAPATSTERPQSAPSTETPAAASAAIPAARVAEPSAASPTALAEIDPEQLEQVVRQLLPPIVKEVLAGLLRQTIGARVEKYATSKIDAFVENELPGLADAAIEAKLAELTDE